MPTLVRPHSTNLERQFPPVERLFAAGDQSPGARIVALAENPFGFHLRNPPARHFRAALWLHKAGIEAEMENRWKRADFYWDEARRHLTALGRDRAELLAAVGRILSGQLPGMSAPEIGQCAARWLDEVFVDVHAGFFNARARRAGELPLDDRAFAHVARLPGLLAYSALSPAEAVLFLRPARRYRAEMLQAKKQWPLAIAAAQELFDAEPDNAALQDAYVSVIFRGTLESLNQNTESERANRQDAEMLEKAIAALSAARSRMARNTDLYDVLSQLCFMQSIRWANGGKLPQALLSVQKALAIRPSFEEAEKVRTQLTDMMQKLQTRVVELEQMVRAKPNATLNAEGLAMQSNARLGFAPRDRFTVSPEARNLTHDAQAARNQLLWRNLGLPAPSGDWDAAAAHLLDAIVQVAARQPATPASIAAIWKVTADASLAALDARKIEAFLSHRLLDTAWEPAKQPAEPSDAIPAGDPPMMPTREGAARSGGVPFRCWFFSGQDLGMKLRWTATLALVVVGVFLCQHEEREHGRRDQAYTALTASLAAHDNRGVMTAAEQFLSAHPFAPDARREGVVAAYRQALVSWFAGLREVSPADVAAVARFRQLTQARPDADSKS